MSDPAKARFEDAGDKTLGCDVMFNPASLKVSLTNKLQDDQSGGGGKGAKQNTQGTTTKLETELIFDTTQDGSDVRDWSKKLKLLAQTIEGANPKPPRVLFRWGSFAYMGVIESLNETLDFWSSEGVPLRSTIQVVMQGVDQDFVPDNPPKKAVLNKLPPGGKGVTDLATRAGNPRGGRQLAAANGLASMRAGAGATVSVTAGVQLKAAAGFSLSAGASAGAGASIGFGAGAQAGGSAGIGIGAGASAGFGAGASAGFGASASAGFGASASAGFGAGASAGFGASASAGFGADASAGFGAGASTGFGASASASAFGASASASSFSSSSSAYGASASYSYGASATAGVSASDGAFAGLGTSKTESISVSLDPSRLLPPPPSVMVTSGAQFDVAGRVIASSSAGLSADVRGGVRVM